MFSRATSKWKTFERRLLDRWGVLSGFRVSSLDNRWFEDPEYERVWSQFPLSDQVIHERRRTLYYLSKHAGGLPGKLVDVGTFRGASSFLMLAATVDKTLIAFDSFEGLSEPDLVDMPVQLSKYRWKAKMLACSEEEYLENLGTLAFRVTTKRGWIPERFAEVASEDFAMVHIDVDLYKPTLDSLEFFWPRVVEGGFILLDDYGSQSCPGARRAADKFAASHSLQIVKLTSGQGVIFRGPAKGD